MLNQVFNECVDTNECANGILSSTSHNSSSVDVRIRENVNNNINNQNNKGVCGNAQCQNSFGSYACICPGGYQYDHAMKVLPRINDDNC